MGFGDYIHGKKKTKSGERKWPGPIELPPPQYASNDPFAEPPSGTVTPNASDALMPGHIPVPDIPISRSDSHAATVSTRRRLSFSGSVQSVWTEDIKHEVMVNYLFQQQCSSMWVGDGSGQVEGVMLRRSRGNYISCPPQLVESPFGNACEALNVQVGGTRD